jgi:hypothetical protein
MHLREIACDYSQSHEHFPHMKEGGSHNNHYHTGVQVDIHRSYCTLVVPSSRRLPAQIK